MTIGAARCDCTTTGWSPMTVACAGAPTAQARSRCDADARCRPSSCSGSRRMKSHTSFSHQPPSVADRAGSGMQLVERERPVGERADVDRLRARERPRAGRRCATCCTSRRCARARSPESVGNRRDAARVGDDRAGGNARRSRRVAPGFIEVGVTRAGDELRVARAEAPLFQRSRISAVPATISEIGRVDANGSKRARARVVVEDRRVGHVPVADALAAGRP